MASNDATDYLYVFAPHGMAPVGPCGLCGYPDKRHRMWDMVADRFKAGETIADLAADYDLPESIVEQYLRLSMTVPKKPRKK